MIRVVLPFHLQRLAKVGREVTVTVNETVTVDSILDALEAAYPVLRGLIREHETGKRRRLLRFFACGKDYTFEPTDLPLPADLGEGKEPFMIVGAIAGG